MSNKEQAGETIGKEVYELNEYFQSKQSQDPITVVLAFVGQHLSAVPKEKRDSNIEQIDSRILEFCNLFDIIRESSQ